MPHDKFVIVDTSKGLYFAKKQKDRLTKDSKKVSWWTDKKDAQKILNQIAKKPAIKQKVGKLTVMKLQDAEKKIAQNANQFSISPAPYWLQAEHLFLLDVLISDTSLERSKRLDCISQLNEELKRLTTDHNLNDLTAVYRNTNPNTDFFDYNKDAIAYFIRQFIYTYPKPIAKNLITDSTGKIDDQEVNVNGTEQAKIFNNLKLVCSIVAKFQQEELWYIRKALYMLAVESNELKSSISKKIKEYDNKDLDFLHVIELGKFDAVEWTKLIISERENRQKRRQYKDEWLAIDALFPNTEPDMAKIKSQAKKCLETIELVENNNRKYAFRDKESKQKFGNLLK